MILIFFIKIIGMIKKSALLINIHNVVTINTNNEYGHLSPHSVLFVIVISQYSSTVNLKSCGLLHGAGCCNVFV
jgi:hypothetical protein